MLEPEPPPAPVLLRHLEACRLIGTPVVHRKVVRHDASARLELQYLWPQVEIHARQQIHRDHCRVREIRLEQIALEERYSIRNAGLRRVFHAFLDAHGIQIDTETARPVFFRSGDNDTSVAGPEINQIVLRRHFRHLQHAVDHDLRRWHIRDRALPCKRRYCEGQPCDQRAVA